ncbi:MAG: PHP domain-containing protein, partial [Balneolaceae bacterium]|nr:PHP domain-containing protein [Balneolaceae bacterium]
MGKADLHIHTNASDGDLSPEDLIKKVSQKKDLATISITDHD